MIEYLFNQRYLHKFLTLNTHGKLSDGLRSRILGQKLGLVWKANPRLSLSTRCFPISAKLFLTLSKIFLNLGNILENKKSQFLVLGTMLLKCHLQEMNYAFDFILWHLLDSNIEKFAVQLKDQLK